MEAIRLRSMFQGSRGLEVLHRGGLGQGGEQVPQVAVGLDPCGFGGFDEAVEPCTGLRTGGRIGEEPRFATDYKGTDGVL